MISQSRNHGCYVDKWEKFEPRLVNLASMGFTRNPIRFEKKKRLFRFKLTFFCLKHKKRALRGHLLPWQTSAVGIHIHLRSYTGGWSPYLVSLSSLLLFIYSSLFLLFFSSLFTSSSLHLSLKTHVLYKLYVCIYLIYIQQKYFLTFF